MPGGLSMSFDEMPTVENLKEQMRGYGLILRANRFLLRFGLGSRRIDALQGQLDQMDAQLTGQTEYATKFNRYFSEDGWLAHGLFDVSIMQRTVDTYEADGAEAANEILLDHYGPDEMAHRVFLIHSVKEVRDRWKFVDLALEDYRAERYHAVVPILLMVIDGATNDAVGRGFHAANLELDVWDSLTPADGAINDNKSIFQKSRRKTRTEPISLPYRHGILHGMDLGYDNKVVAAKCWCFLFVVADWIKAKNSEAERRVEFERETRTPKLREVAATMARTRKLKEAVAGWSPRDLPRSYLAGLSDGQNPQQGSPEGAVLEFIARWKRRNYGEMAMAYCHTIAPNPARYAKEVNDQFSGFALSSFSIIQITDESPAISVVEATIAGSNEQSTSCEFRLIYEAVDGDSLVRGMPGGEWRILWVHLS